MKLETGWDHCLFIVETENDIAILSLLYDEIISQKGVSVKRKQGKIKELYIVTYN